MPTCYIATRKFTGGLFGRLIKMKTVGDITHVEFVFPDKVTSFSADENDGGCRFRDDLPFTNEKIWKLFPIELTDEQLNEVQKWCQLKAGKSYDKWGVIKFYIGRVSDKEDKYLFCSEAVGRIMHLIGRWKWKNPAALSPLTIHDMMMALQEVSG